MQWPIILRILLGLNASGLSKKHFSKNVWKESVLSTFWRKRLLHPYKISILNCGSGLNLKGWRDLCQSDMPGPRPVWRCQGQSIWRCQGQSGVPGPIWGARASRGAPKRVRSATASLGCQNQSGMPVPVANLSWRSKHVTYSLVYTPHGTWRAWLVLV